MGFYSFDFLYNILSLRTNQIVQIITFLLEQICRTDQQKICNTYLWVDIVLEFGQYAFGNFLTLTTTTPIISCTTSIYAPRKSKMVCNLKGKK
jgi:hypothetical protein